MNEVHSQRNRIRTKRPTNPTLCWNVVRPSCSLRCTMNCPFRILEPVQEIVFDLGITAVGDTFTLAGLVVRGYSGHQMLFEQRWPERVIRQKTRLEDTSIPNGTGIAIRAMHFQLHGYERITSVEITAVGQGLQTQQSRQAILSVPVEYPELRTNLHFPLTGVWWAIQAADWSDMHKTEVLSQPYSVDFVKLGAGQPHVLR